MTVTDIPNETIGMALDTLGDIQKRLDKINRQLNEYSSGLTNEKHPLGADDTIVTKGIQSLLDEGRDLARADTELRARIAYTNTQTMVTIRNIDKPISDWVVWKRHEGPAIIAMYNNLNRLHGDRRLAQNRGYGSSTGAEAVGVLTYYSEQDKNKMVNETQLIMDEVNRRLKTVNAVTPLLALPEIVVPAEAGVELHGKES